MDKNPDSYTNCYNNRSMEPEMRSKYPIKRLNIGGKEWEYIVKGNGSLGFLLLPGGGQTAQLNFKLIKSFEDRYKVIAPTIYACDSIEEFNSAINIIIEEEGITKLVVYGLSIGGLLAQSYVIRNQGKVTAMVLSHACTPKSKTYYKKVIIPLKLLAMVLPLIPDSFIRFITKNFHARVQGAPKQGSRNVLFNDDELVLNNFYRKEFYEKYLNKRLLKTWIKLHLDFFNNEHLNHEILKDWKGKVLILRTDNDPLMQDEGDFRKVYPEAKQVIFKDTGHLTFYYQFDEIVREIENFLK